MSMVKTLYTELPHAFYQQLQQIKLLVCDVDGVFSDGRIYLGNQGEELKAFHTRDGYGVKALVNAGIEVAVITGRRSAIVKDRMTSLKVSHIIQGEENKADALADELQDLLPENALDAIREKVSAHLNKRVEAGDRAAIMHRGDYFLEILAEPDHGRAYVWYSIGAAMKLKGAYQARNDAAENLESEDLIDLQEEATQIFREMKASGAPQG